MKLKDLMGNILNLARSNPENIAMATKFVTEAIAKDKVVIFSKTYCPYCTMAKEVSEHSVWFLMLKMLVLDVLFRKLCFVRQINSR